MSRVLNIEKGMGGMKAMGRNSWVSGKKGTRLWGAGIEQTDENRKIHELRGPCRDDRFIKGPSIRN
jgi:hypothetical protein